MLGTRLKLRDRYPSMASGRHLDEFVIWLESRGYRPRSVDRHSGGAARFAGWAQGKGVTALDRESLDRFCSRFKRRDTRRSSGRHWHVVRGAKLFMSFLEAIGVATPRARQDKPIPDILLNFEEWMRTQHGARATTINNYRLPLSHLLQTLGTDPRAFDVKGLRQFLLDGVDQCGAEKLKRRATAVRVFVRFLVAQGLCAPRLQYAIPRVSSWKLASLPKYLPATDVEHLINSCNQDTPIGARDRAMLLLMARLGLRASDVSGLKICDIGWSEGTLIVSGKNRRRTRLPLPQDVGDALLHYLRCARPKAASDRVFLSAVAPVIPITRHVVSWAVASALRRTGVNSSTKGAQLLRHSAATSLLRSGVSLPAIGSLLRHASIQTTTLYAKVDVNLLQGLAMPWPEALPC